MNQLKRLFWMVMLPIALIGASTGCAWWQENKQDVKTVVQTVDTLAQNLCGVFYGEKVQLSVTDAITKFCDTRDKYEPWIDQVLAGAKAGGDVKLGLKPATAQTTAVPTLLGDPWAPKPADTATAPPTTAAPQSPPPAATVTPAQTAAPTTVQATAPPTATPEAKPAAKGKVGAK